VDYRSPRLEGVVEFDAHFSDRVSHTGLAQQLSDVETEQRSTGSKHIEGMKKIDFNLLQAYLQFNSPCLLVRSGRFKQRWGPGYKGTLSLSGTTFAPMYYYWLQLRMGDILRGTAFLNGLDDSHLFGSVYPYKGDTTVDHTVYSRFTAGQRVDLKLGQHFQLGLFELAVFYRDRLLAQYANPLQVYYFSNITSGTDGQRSTNILGGGDFNITFPRFRVYGAFLNDDITTFDDNGSPNKFALQCGVMGYGDGMLRDYGLEYTHVAWGTYGHSSPGRGRHVYWDEPRGWPWGNDQDCWSLHGRWALPYDVRLVSECNFWVKGPGEVSDYHWDWEPAKIDSLDLDNKGGFCDYKNDDKMLSLLMDVSWHPHRAVDLGCIYRPAFGTGMRPHHLLKVYGVFTLPGRIALKR
jgi:hypothetical protein